MLAISSIRFRRTRIERDTVLILSSAPAAATILTSDDGKSVLTSDAGTRILTPDIIEAVYREHGPLLNRVAVNAYGEIGEDLLQDVFAQLVADPPAYKVRNPVGFLRKKLWFAFQHYLSRPLNHSENFKEFDDDAVVPPRQEIRVLLMEAWRALTPLQQGKLLQRE